MEESPLQCRRCLLREAGNAGALESVKDSIARLPAHCRVSEEEYGIRLARCQACDHLLAGTCLLCGCYVELRAAMAEQFCPGAPRRWDRVKARDNHKKQEGE